MYKGGKIFASLIIFAALFTIPFFYNMGKVNAGPDVALNTAAIQQLPASEQQCVESPEFMRANHMQLLNQWREEAVRNGQTVYVNSQGKKFEISLQDTCLKCHATESASKPAVLNNPVSTTAGVSNPALNESPAFCASCHDYSAVKPQCWSCHFEPKEATK
ncbi:sulfate reduction electron transfer complex DsrMKJOP subunit DsrJ [Desulfosporosinus sp.]|uniref:sulfate reduction electron transfer complex DsrMKJOP subunit DsrJ n=1 Tax=Desulfosporosinus sp. TaxID=157907 RepID=UPI00230DA1BE|nr:sulfate reduction electron transfer complex DsrMKJOP subunit DsrJ [Desulfosporosinus sp.]MDA8224247.1 sulfate reduction electron transfer complex DsrMKJOP subunit DsrJ [Desulfitobacterium hafniense]